MRMIQDGVCVLASGGLDSAVLLDRCLKTFREVYPLYVETGMRWESAEKHWLKRLLKVMSGPRLRPLTVVRFPVQGLYGKHWSLGYAKPPSAKAPWDSVYLPGRNLLLLTAAGVFCASRGIGVVAIGTLAGNPFEDSRRRFFSLFERLLGRLFPPIRVLSPLSGFDKERIVREASRLLHPLTFSCLDPAGFRPCGYCTKCYEREQGFQRAGIPEAVRRADVR